MIASRKRIAMLAAASIAAIVAAAAPAAAQVPSFNPPPLQRPTFAAAAPGLALPLTGALDAFCITGSATKTVRIKRVEISGFDTTAQTAGVNLVLRSTANSGGTSTVPADVALDQTNAVGTAVVRAYTVAPTPGTSLGAIRASSIGFNVAGALGGPVTWEFNPNLLQQEVVLRGVAQSACINFPAAFTTAGPNVNINVTWTE